MLCPETLTFFGHDFCLDFSGRPRRHLKATTPSLGCTRTSRGARHETLTESDGNEAVPAWKGETELRSVPPMPARQGETQLRGLQLLPSRQAETGLRGVQLLPPGQAEKQLR